jgi:uncharacterized protein involved in exopolysaccharide biosynthesis
MPATHNNSIATEESLRFSLRDLAPPILRRKRTLSVTFLFVVSVTLLLGYVPFQKYQSHRTILAQTALTNTKAAPDTMPGMQGSQSFNEADLDREAKRDEQMYLLYLSTREQQRSEGTSASTIPNATITVPSSIPPLPAHTSAVIILIAIVLGLLIGLSVTYLVDYRDPCFHSPVQVIRTLRIPLVVAIPKRTS